MWPTLGGSQNPIAGRADQTPLIQGDVIHVMGLSSANTVVPGNEKSPGGLGRGVVNTVIAPLVVIVKVVVILRGGMSCRQSED